MTVEPRQVLKATAAAADGVLQARRLVLFGLLVALSYIATGRLGLLLAVPPGYATAIFPPAGIATTAMMVAGWRTLPWTFIGSFALNLWIGGRLDLAQLPAASLVAASIALPSTLQAGMAGWALRTATGYPSALDTGGQLLRVLLLSPLCCLTSASLSLAALWALSVVPSAELATSWVSWWVGDTLGLLIVLPLMLVLVGEPRRLWRPRLWPVALPMLLFFGLFVAIFARVSAWEEDEQLLEFRLVSQQTLDKIRTRLDEQSVLLQQLERTFSRAMPIDRHDFKELVAPALARFPMLQAIEWAPRVATSDRAAFEAAQRREIPDFTIRSLQAPEQEPSPGASVDFYPVTYVEPRHGNEAAIGLDLASGSEREAALAVALKTGVLSSTAPIRLVQEAGDGQGLLLLLPVRGGGSGPGVLLVALDAGNFINAILADARATLRLRLVDDASRQPLFDGFSIARRQARYRQEFDFAQRRYAVETRPTRAYLAHERRWQSWILLVAGVLGTGLLGALLLLGTGYAQRVRMQVDERTRDLAAANDRLRHEIQERRNAEVALRQAQRMEAIGRLTGGIAHDFNNLLTVVGANAELLQSDSASERSRRSASAILRAAARGERLIRQLLTFSRQQTLHPAALDLRRRADELAEMLSRTMGGNIKMTVDLPAGLWPVAIDPDEFDLAFVNIAVNARDAMPNGGRFRLVARNRTLAADDVAGDGLAGDFVALTLSDTGSGMTAEVMAHAFDPYFTTKGPAAGSGLGLSQVYGFARQSGGAAVLASTLGTGTSVTLYLPRAADRRDAEPWPPEARND